MTLIKRRKYWVLFNKKRLSGDAVKVQKLVLNTGVNLA